MRTFCSISPHLAAMLYFHLQSREAPFCLRAHPESSDSWRGIWSKSPAHDADHGEADACGNGRSVAFEVASQATVTTDPRERSFDDHRLGSTSNPAASNRLTICKLQAPVRHTIIAILRPAYAPSAKMRSMNGNSRLARRSKWKAPSRS